jgi:hypothetical protein
MTCKTEGETRVKHIMKLSTKYDEVKMKNDPRPTCHICGRWQIVTLVERFSCDSMKSAKLLQAIV